MTQGWWKPVTGQAGESWIVPEERALGDPTARESAPAVEICLLGAFRILARGGSLPLKPGGKSEQFLGALALGARHGVGRDELLELVWPAASEGLATQSLNTLVHDMNRRLAMLLDGASAILRRDGRYQLNTGAGVVVDVHAFDAAADAGDRFGREGDGVGAIRSYGRAVSLYAGDLVIAGDVRLVLERERLRARYLSVRSRLADHHFAAGTYASALLEALSLLGADPCREDAHRMAMRCYVRLGERAQALRQFRVCREVLRLEFDVEPEGATRDLYEAIRLDPGSI